MDHCKRHLEPLHPAIWRTISGAFALFRELPAKHQAIFTRTKRTRATVIWQYIMEVASEQLAVIPGLVPHTAHETTTYEATSGQIEMRLKKVNSRGFSSNYPTKRALSFFARCQYEIFADCWSAPFRVDIGYTPDPLGLYPEQIVVVCRQGNAIQWMYPIDNPETGTQVLPIQPAVTPSPVRIVAKQRRKKASNDDTGGGSR